MSVLLRSGCRFIAAIATAATLSGCTNPPAADAQDGIAREAMPPRAAADIDSHIAEASQRFRIPEDWIRAVMRAESAGDPRAVSPAGAMGLMQIMPGTWAELRAAHDLGSDSFDQRDNILGGTAYLRQMYDQFGAPGFLAAYNAGPGRYANHLRTGRPLPRETRAYVAGLSRVLGFSNDADPQRTRSQTASTWQAAPVFAPISPPSNAQTDTVSDEQSTRQVQPNQSHAARERMEQGNPIFVRRSEENTQ